MVESISKNNYGRKVEYVIPLIFIALAILLTSIFSALYITRDNVFFISLILSFLIIFVIFILIYINFYITNKKNEVNENIFRKEKREAMIKWAKIDKNTVYFAVLGECKSCISILFALEKAGIPVEMVFGNKIFDPLSKIFLAAIKCYYSDKIKIFKLSERPEIHVSRVGNDIFLENRHEIFDNYRRGKIFQNADKRMIQIFSTYFNNFKKSGTELDPEEILLLPEYTNKIDKSKIEDVKIFLLNVIEKEKNDPNKEFLEKLLIKCNEYTNLINHPG